MRSRFLVITLSFAIGMAAVHFWLGFTPNEPDRTSTAKRVAMEKTVAGATAAEPTQGSAERLKRERTGAAEGLRSNAPDVFARIARDLGKQWGAADPEGASEYGAQLTGGDRKQFMMGVFEGWASVDRPAAWTAFAELAVKDAALIAGTELPELAQGLLTNSRFVSPKLSQSESLMLLKSPHPKSDAEAKQLLDQLMVKDTNSNLALNFVCSFAVTHPAAAAAAIQGNESLDSEMRKTLLDAIFSSAFKLENQQALIDWTRGSGMDSGMSDERIARMAPNLAQVDPTQAYQVVSQISDVSIRGRELSNLLVRFAGTQPFEASVAAYSSAPWPSDHPQRTIAALAIASARAATDRPAAIAFIQADSKLSESAKAGIIARLP